MATPMTSTQIVTQLKRWQIPYTEIPGWATHNRAGHGAWGPVNGFVWHHTGADVSDAKAYAAGTLYNGLSDLPGPLCHFSIGRDGMVYLVGWGRTNHAGGGDPAVLQHVIAEDYTGQLHPTKGNTTGVDGNAHFYGVEIQYSGTHAMSTAQYQTGLRLSAAVCEWHGWSDKSVIAHGEWSSDKWDPGYAPGKIMAMPAVRSDVAVVLKAGPSGVPASVQEDAVALTDDEITRVWQTDGTVFAARPPVGNSDYDTNKTWTAAYALQTTVEGVRKTQALAQSNGAALSELKTAVSALSGGGVDVGALATALAQAPGLVDAIATRVADLLAARLAE